MKKIIHYSLFVAFAMFTPHLSWSQEITYSEKGFSYTKGTIDTEVLIELIQEKQKELNKFVLSRIVTKTWIEPGNKKIDSASRVRINNFTTKYLIYSSLNELVVSGDKATFGKNTIEMLKEAAMIYGIAVAVNGQVSRDTAALQIRKSDAMSSTITYGVDPKADAFNVTLDMVLNICITNPALKAYFPMYGQLANTDNENYTWYENDSRYYPNRNQPATAALYNDISTEVDSLINVVEELNQIRKSVKDKDVDAALDQSAALITPFVMPGAVKLLKSDTVSLNRIIKQLQKPEMDSLRADFMALNNKMGSPKFDAGFVALVKKVRFDYETIKPLIYASQNTNYDSSKVNAFLKAFKSYISEKDKKLNKRFNDFSDQLGKTTKNGATVPKSTISNWLEETANLDPSWDSIVSQRRFSGYTFEAKSLIERALDELDKLASRTETIRSLLTALATAQKSNSLNEFLLQEPQFIATKDLINSFINHIDKSGKYNVAAVYLRSIVDNISYQQKDSVNQKPASISLNFESVLLKLNENLVTPSRLERTRYFEPYINIGLNYASFLEDNNLQQQDDGTTSTLKNMTFASEKIGVKYKIINRKYTRSFKPGVTYKYYGKYWAWNRPQQKSMVDDWFLDIHSGGLLYNLVNLKTDENFNFPYIGAGTGVRFFNGLTTSISYSVPYTNNTFRATNGFLLFSIDVPIVEYISKLGK